MSKPSTCREVIEKWGDRDFFASESGGIQLPDVLLVERVEKVLALHQPDERKVNCRHCYYQWPCPTVRDLNGEE